MEVTNHFLLPVHLKEQEVRCFHSKIPSKIVVALTFNTVGTTSGSIVCVFVCVLGDELDEVNMPSKHLSARLVARQQSSSIPLHFVLLSRLSATERFCCPSTSNTPMPQGSEEEVEEEGGRVTRRRGTKRRRRREEVGKEQEEEKWEEKDKQEEKKGEDRQEEIKEQEKKE